MKKRTMVALATSVLLAAMLPGAASAGGVGASASGSGHVIWLDGLRTFSFTVREMPDGSVKGRAQNNTRSFPDRSKWALDCLFVDGSTAYVSGRVVESTDAASIGKLYAFKVTDNGEGGAAPPDQITFFYAVEQDCDDPATRALFAGPGLPVERGNIQVD